MEDVHIEIEGLAALSDALTTQTAAAAKRYLGRCGDKAAQVVVEALEQTVPVEAGILEETITWQKKWLEGDDETTMEIRIGPTKLAFWGSFQEFGTEDREGTDKRGRHFHHAAQPPQRWMTRAWESSKDKCLSAFATEALGILHDLENRK